MVVDCFWRKAKKLCAHSKKYISFFWLAGAVFPREQTTMGKQKAQHTLQYSKREEEQLKEAFLALTKTNKALEELENTKADLDELTKTMVNFSVSTGETFNIVRLLIQHEFESTAGAQEGSIMRGTGMATKFIKSYIYRVGRQYLKVVLGDFLHRLVVNQGKISLEVDPSKEGGEDGAAARNFPLLLEKAQHLVDRLMSPEILEKMPAEMRIIAGYIAEFARKYAPSQVWPLVGGFILLRYINPVLSNPEAFDLVAEGKTTPIARRNLVLITKILQNLSNNVDFGKKEQFMVQANAFIRTNRKKMEAYLESVVKFASKTTVSCVPDPTALEVEDMHFWHKLVDTHRTPLLAALESDQKQSLSRCLEKLGSYENKMNFSFLEQADQKVVKQLLEQYNEEASYVSYISGSTSISKKATLDKRILVVGFHRVFLLKQVFVNTV